MPAYITMPKLADTMEAGTLVKWKIKEGDTVEMGDIVAEIETDKATMEMESFEEGKVHRLYIEEGKQVPIGYKLALILEDGEDPPDNADNPDQPDAPAAKSDDEDADDDPAAGAFGDDSESETGENDNEGDENEREGGTEGGRIKASPLARKIAKERGIKLSKITGTGPGGRIVKKDVLAAKAGSAKPAAKSGSGSGAAAPAQPAIRATAGEGDQRLPLSNMRRVIAERLLASKQQIPHFYLNIEVDAGPLMAIRKQINAAAGENGNKYTVNDFILRAIVGACKAVPAANAAFDGDAIIQFGSIHLAVAVAIDDGLVTPVIRDAGNKTLKELSLTVKDLAARARDKKLKPDEMQGGTITVSNLGAYGIETFDAIINPPQAAILSIGAINAKPVVNASGEIVAGQRMGVGMSCDHRVVDGAVGATFLAEFRKLIENPTLMLV